MFVFCSFPPWPFPRCILPPGGFFFHPFVQAGVARLGAGAPAFGVGWGWAVPVHVLVVRFGWRGCQAWGGGG